MHLLPHFMVNLIPNFHPRREQGLARAKPVLREYALLSVQKFHPDIIRAYNIQLYPDEAYKPSSTIDLETRFLDNPMEWVVAEIPDGRPILDPIDPSLIASNSKQDDVSSKKVL